MTPRPPLPSTLENLAITPLCDTIASSRALVTPALLGGRTSKRVFCDRSKNLSAEVPKCARTLGARATRGTPVPLLLLLLSPTVKVLLRIERLIKGVCLLMGACACVYVCFYHVKPVVPAMDVQHTRCPCRFFVLQRHPLVPASPACVVTKLKYETEKLHRICRTCWVRRQEHDTNQQKSPRSYCTISYFHTNDE